MSKIYDKHANLIDVEDDEPEHCAADTVILWLMFLIVVGVLVTGILDRWF